MFNFDKFTNCNTEYRSAPFWSLNDTLEENELVQQIQWMHEQGMGGFFMHPRGGLTDEYMGERFLEVLGVCIKEADRLGMKAWLYDEDRFPSGYAGGLVVKNNPSFASKVLHMERMPSHQVTEDAGGLDLFFFDETDGIVKAFKDISGQCLEEIHRMNANVLVFRIMDRPALAQFNKLPYADVCNKEAMDSFIKYTHEKYAEHYHKYFSKVIPGIFTDEPNFSPGSSGNQLPWTAGLENEFANRKGYNLKEYLPALFYKVGNWQKVRFDFWDILSSMFVTAYTRNTYQWCGKNGLDFTGHFWEHLYPLPTYTGSVMPNYEYMHMPGIDMLFVNSRWRKDQFENAFIVKEATSVSNQLGKKRVISETYGGSGWELNLSDQKRVVDWQCALGINFICQHLTLYSLRGYRKRDFPLSFNHHQPWWECYKPLGDYIGRLSYILSQGDPVGDILVIHPSSTSWAEYTPGPGHGILSYNTEGENDYLQKISEQFIDLCRTLSRQHCFYDLGDDILMERHGRVEGNRLVIGRMAYRVVIVPDMTLLRKSGFDLLKQFVACGGIILCVGTTPYLLEGEVSGELKDFFNSAAVKKVCREGAELKKILQQAGCTVLQIEAKNGGTVTDIYCGMRKSRDMFVIFLCHCGREGLRQVRVKLEPCGSIEEWDASTGGRRGLEFVCVENLAYVDLEFEPAQSHLLVIRSDSKKKSNPSREKQRKCIRNIELRDWRVRRLEDNALTLSRCSVSLDGQEWEKEENVLVADDTLKGWLEMEKGSPIAARQPWMYTDEEKSRKHHLRVKYCFYINEMPEGKLYAAAESPDIWRMYVNGHEVKPSGGYYKDRAFVLNDISGCVAEGRNEAILETHQYGVLVSVESIYITGSFAVGRSEEVFYIQRETEAIKPGDWTKQGYPFYSGCMEYSTTIQFNREELQKVEWEMEDFQGGAAQLTVNGIEAAILAWRPYKADISSYLSEGSNTLKVQIMNTLQNLLGPHQKLEREGCVTPGSFHSSDMVHFEASGFAGQSKIMVYE